MKIQRLLNKVKYNAYLLKEGGQIPPFLFKKICLLDDSSSEEDIRVLMECTTHYTRLKGYYFRYHFSDIEKEINEFIETRKGK